jgi:serine/threonine protein kinase
MKLEPGARLAHYEISAMIGKGGMGEVYRATDPRLPREAKVIASLNHPNICTLFDVGPDFLVIELMMYEPWRAMHANCIHTPKSASSQIRVSCL